MTMIVPKDEARFVQGERVFYVKKGFWLSCTVLGRVGTQSYLLMGNYTHEHYVARSSSIQLYMGYS